MRGRNWISGGLALTLIFSLAGCSLAQPEREGPEQDEFIGYHLVYEPIPGEGEVILIEDENWVEYGSETLDLGAYGSTEIPQKILIGELQDNGSYLFPGKEGLNFMHRNLLTVELEDYKAWMRYLFEKYPFIEREKIGITGFSYGGSMTALAVTEGSDCFKYGIAGGGVYDYALYDTHYAERYMDTPQDNPEGYAHTRLMERIASYKGDSTNFLRITHGTADDNVHMQNTMQYINTLQNAGMQFELMLYPGEYHGYRGPKAVHSKLSDYIFWYRYLLDTVPPKMLLEKK